jgi:hypothetical protein
MKLSSRTSSLISFRVTLKRPEKELTLDDIEGKLAVVAMLFEVRAETKEEPWKSLLAAENLNHKIPLVGEETNTPVLDFQSVMKNILGDVYQ